jgi:hypothetical protein
VSNLEQWAGFHIYHRQSFPTTTFSALSLQLRTRSGGGELGVAPSHDGRRCEETAVRVGDDWVEVEIDVASDCAGLADLGASTVSNQSDTIELLVDEIRCEQGSESESCEQASRTGDMARHRRD